MSWSATFAWAVKRLHRRGVDGWSAEDAVQEAAARAISRRVEFDDESHRRAWMAAAAYNIAVDAHRKQARLAAPPGHDLPDPQDVAELVEHRHTLAAVSRAIPHLAAHERAALVDDHGHADRKERQRLATARHRARAKLLAMVEGAGVFVALKVDRMRRLLERVDAGMVASYASVAIVAAAAANPFSVPPGPVSQPPQAVANAGGAADTLLPSAAEDNALHQHAADATVAGPAAATSTSSRPTSRVQAAGATIIQRDASPDEPAVCVHLPGSRCAHRFHLPDDVKRLGGQVVDTAEDHLPLP